MGLSSIEWTDYTFNPWWGCVAVSPACDHCYAERLDARLKRGGERHWGKGTPRYPASDKVWADPLIWNRAAEKAGVRRRVFCGSMCDVMEEREFVSFPGDSHLPTERKRLYELIERTPWLDWLLLTKRPQNFRRFLPSAWLAKPHPNVWLMTTVESAEYLWRVEDLLRTPAVVHGLSMEPLLGLVDLRKILTRNGDTLDALLGEVCSKESGCVCEEIPGLGWIITGGESGPKARPSHPAWFRSLRDQCVKTDTPFHFKQWGEWMHDSQQVAQSKDTLGLLVLLNGEPGERHDWDDGTSSYRIGKKNAGRVLDGRTWDELPKVGA